MFNSRYIRKGCYMCCLSNRIIKSGFNRVVYSRLVGNKKILKKKRLMISRIFGEKGVFGFEMGFCDVELIGFFKEIV